MLLPARVKFRKVHRGRRTGVATQGNDLAFGEFGLQASEAAWMSNRQIEAARRVMTRFVRRGGQVFIRVFPDKSVTKKPAETRMGSGKGAPEGWVAVIKPGRVLFEMGGVTPEMAKRAFQLAAYKLPMKTRTLGIKSGVKAAVDVKIKGPAEVKQGEGVEGIAGATAAPTAGGAMTEEQETADTDRAMRKTRTGTVISDKMDKTVVVRVQTLKEHPRYKKHIQQSTRFKAHDEQNQCKVGDRVRIMETRPLSHDKRWRVVAIVEKAK